MCVTLSWPPQTVCIGPFWFYLVVFWGGYLCIVSEAERHDRVYQVTCKLYLALAKFIVFPGQLHRQTNKDAFYGFASLVLCNSIRITWRVSCMPSQFSMVTITCEMWLKWYSIYIQFHDVLQQKAVIICQHFSMNTGVNNHLKLFANPGPATLLWC